MRHVKTGNRYFLCIGTTPFVFFFVCAFGEVRYFGSNIAILQCTIHYWGIASTFSKLLGKMLGSFGTKIGPQNATDIARKVWWENACKF